MYNKRSEVVLKLLIGYIVINDVSSLNSQIEKEVEIPSTVSKTTDKPRTLRHKSSKSYMSNPMLYEITDSGFPDVTYPTSIIDAREQFYFVSGGIDDVLKPFSDDVRNSYKALKAEKVTNPKTLDEINVAKWKKPLTNQTVPQTLTKDNINKVNPLNCCDKSEILNDFITKDVNNTITCFDLESIEVNDLNTTICSKDVSEDRMLLFGDKTQLNIYTETENKNKTNDMDYKFNSDAKVNIFLSDSKESKDEITNQDPNITIELEFLTKLNNARNVFNSILNGIENLQPSEKKLNNENAMGVMLSKDYQTQQDKRTTTLEIYDEESISNSVDRKIEDASPKSSKKYLNFDSDIVSNISDDYDILRSLMSGQAKDKTLTDSSETQKDVLALIDQDNNTLLKSHDYNGLWVVNSTDSASDLSNVLYKIYWVGPLPLLDSTEFEEDDSNELTVKSAANSIFTHDGFKSARKPLSTLFNFSSSHA